MIDLAGVVKFHGHSCPGRAIGIRAAEIARREIGPQPSSRPICAAPQRVAPDSSAGSPG
ncbi:MAG: hypothetical protein KKB13_26565 [Chloroflexi bacterium]|nr:hypothetical protein [Chloroflexota bacterium]